MTLRDRIALVKYLLTKPLPPNDKLREAVWRYRQAVSSTRFKQLPEAKAIRHLFPAVIRNETHDPMILLAFENDTIESGRSYTLKPGQGIMANPIETRPDHWDWNVQYVFSKATVDKDPT